MDEAVAIAIDPSAGKRRRRRLLPRAMSLALLSVCGAGAALVPGPAFGDEPAVETPVAPEYRLSTILPSAAAASMRTTSIGERQELALGRADLSTGDPLANLRLEDLLNPLERPRATVRYAWFSEPGWDIKIGLSTALDTGLAWQKFMLFAPERARYVSMPTMHVSSQSRLSEHWLFSVSAEGLRTAHGQGLDMDLRVDYSLTRSLNLFGGYRLTDSMGEGVESYGFLPSNYARLGVRMSF